MKYIKSINEYSRTVGFRYSKPRESFHAILFFVGKLDESSFQSILNNIEVVSIPTPNSVSIVDKQQFQVSSIFEK